MKLTLEKLFAGEVLTKEEASTAMENITTGSVALAQVAAFLTAYKMRKVVAQELAGFREALLKSALPCKTDYAVIDLCGTGGDGKNTFNISTTAAFIVAACDVKVAKHGNYSASSICGSSNVLEALKIPFAKNAEHANKQLEKIGITFLHAPYWHPAMKTVAPVRKELGFKTIFNLLGPLVNPARPKFQLIGVSSIELLKLYPDILNDSEQKFSVVYGNGGFDEISLTSYAYVNLNNHELKIEAEDFGASAIKEEDLVGGETIEAFALTLSNILAGKGSDSQNSVVAANAAVALTVARESTDIKSMYQEALEKIKSGAAIKILTILQELT